MAIIYIFKPKGNGAFTIPQTKFVQASTGSGTFVTVLSVTGSGILYNITVKTDLYGEIRITIDGLVFTLGIGSPAVGNLLIFTRQASVSYTLDIYTTSYGKPAVQIEFQDELKVEIRKTTATTIYGKVQYGET